MTAVPGLMGSAVQWAEEANPRVQITVSCYIFNPVSVSSDLFPDTSVEFWGIVLKCVKNTHVLWLTWNINSAASFLGCWLVSKPRRFFVDAGWKTFHCFNGFLALKKKYLNSRNFRYQFFNTVYASHMSGHAEFVSLIHCSSWTPRFSSQMATQMRDMCDLDVMTEHQIFIQCLWVNVTCAADQAASSAEAHRVFPVRRTCVKWTVSFCVIHMRKNFVENIPACLYRNCTNFGKHIPNYFSEIEQSSWVKRTFIDEQVLKWKLEYKM